MVEEKLADEAQRAVKEINGGCYAFDSGWLWANIDRMTVNEVGERCLTEMVDIAIGDGRTVAAVSAQPEEVLGVNTPAQLAEAERILCERR